MCWKTSNALKRKTAGKGMVVYKVLRHKENGNMLSFFQMFEYVPQKAYSIHGDLDINVYGRDGGVSSISEGFHSYGSECNVYILPDCYAVCSSERRIMHKYYETLQIYGADIVMVECVIPKGSEYYKNTGGEIVSDKIWITDKVIFSDDLIDESRKRIVSFQDIFANNNRV